MSGILIRCDGSHALGLGHVSRCLALADELRISHGRRVTFAMRDPASAGAAAVWARGYDIDASPDDGNAEYGSWLRSLARSRGARAVVVDVRNALSRAALDSCRLDGTLVVTIDDATDRRLASDLAFYPPVPQVEELDWSGFRGQLHVGWDWVILRREFARDAARDDGDASPSTDILVTMGGSDPEGMTEFAMAALDEVEPPVAIRIVVGPAFIRAEELIDVIARSHHSVQVSCAPAEMAPLMRANRLAVCSFGVSAYELAACGVPAVHVCLTPDHARSSSAFEREAIARTAGVWGRLTRQQIAAAVMELLGSAEKRRAMSTRARELVDGRGAIRVAAIVAERAR